MLERMRDLRKDGLTGLDLVTCWLNRRVQPLQARVHKLCFVSRKGDPTRISTKKLALARMQSWLKQIARESVEEGWQPGVPAFSRKKPAPRVSLFDQAFCHLHSSAGLLEFFVPSSLALQDPRRRRRRGRAGF